ncbi:MAG: hypothetical protein D6719_02315 [Candidatus Dadabacteria bacterium]|nr:MAG: hypothetical protein D6719_02315 [Candidatus Dadabacteria bacterium]
MQQGLDELEFVLTTASAGKAEHPFMVDLSVTRGFDYYTGSVYEVIWDEFPSLGVICGGGRYDDLAGAYINKHIPGVGISIGFTRIFSKLVKEGRVVGKRPVPTEVLVTWLEGDDYRKISEIAHNLRDRGIATEVFHSPVALKKQLQYASRRGIPYVFFAPDGEIKDMQSGEQYKVDINSWSPKSEL